jgi:hypothetical protein
MIFEDRLKVYATGLSALTLAVGATITMGAAYPECRTLAIAISDGASNPLRIKVGSLLVPFTVSDGTGNWCDVLCDITSSTMITVRQILGGSNGLNPVTFANSTPTVYNCVPADWLTRIPVDSFPTAFATTVPLTQIGTVHMPRQTVAGNLTFTAGANAVRGAYAEYPIIADGASTLTMSGFTEHGSSAGILNSANMPNTIMFWYDGYTYWWSASQAANPVALDLVAPTMSSGAVANATPSTVTLTASETLDSGFQPAAGAFTISGHTVLAVTGVSGTSVTLSVSPAFVNGEAASTAAYTQPGSNGLRDTAGNLMASFSGLAITNNVQPADVTAPSFSSAQVANAAPTQIVITMSETLANSTPPASAFSVSGGKTVNNVSLSGATVTLTVSSAYVNGDVITVSYTQPGANPRLQDAAGNLTASFGPSSVTNNVAAVGAEALSIDPIATPQTVGTAFNVTGTWSGSPAPTQLDYRLSDDPAGQWTPVTATISSGGTSGTWSFSQTPPSATAGRTLSVRDRNATTVTATSNSYAVNASGTYYPQLLQTTNVTQSGSGPYTITGAGQALNTSTNGGVLSKSLAAGQDGYLEFKDIASGDIVIGFRAQSVQSGYNGDVYSLFITSGGAYYSLKAGVNASLGVNFTSGDVNRVTRVGNVLKLQKAPAANPTNFTDLATFDYGSSPQMWFQVHVYESAAVQLTAASGVS